MDHVRRYLSRTRLTRAVAEVTHQRLLASFPASAIAPPRNLSPWRGMLLGQMIRSQGRQRDRAWNVMIVASYPDDQCNRQSDRAAAKAAQEPLRPLKPP